MFLDSLSRGYEPSICCSQSCKNEIKASIARIQLLSKEQDGMMLAKVKEQDGMMLAKVKEQDGMMLAKVKEQCLQK